MEAKDTVMGIKLEHMSDCAVHNEPAFPMGQCNCRPKGLLNKGDMKILAREVWNRTETYPELVAKVQAEISFKAGIKEVVEWINQAEHLLYVPEGDKETIDHGILLRPSKWQRKLKEWGIEQ